MSVEIRVPAMGESIIEATISRWSKKAGDTVVAGDVLVELETDKINQELVSEHNGTLEKILHQEGDTVTVNEVLALLNESADVTSAVAKAEVNSLPAVENVVSPHGASAVVSQSSAAHSGNALENGKAKSSATPVAQKMAAENKLDLSRIPGSGSGGKAVSRQTSTDSARVHVKHPRIGKAWHTWAT